MIALAWNLLFALIWVLLTGNATAGSFVAGFILAYFVLRFTQRDNPRFASYIGKLPKLAKFIVLFIWDLIKSNARVAYDVLTPSHHMRPAVIGVPLGPCSDLELTILANLITVTPGTLSLDISSDRRTLYIHAMYLDDEQQLRDEIKALERRVIDLLR